MDLNLRNSPLVEVIFELRWVLKEKSSAGGNYDPHYKILIGRMFDRLSCDYPEHKQLPSSSMPDELAAHIVQNQFRSKEDKWPLVQLGPGILTVNATENYSWEDFENRIKIVINALFESYPNAEKDLKFLNVSLRYLNSIDANLNELDAFEWLQNKMNTNILLNPNLFSNNISNVPSGLDFRTSFKSINPEGSVNFRFFTGTINNTDKIIWETAVISQGKEIPPRNGFPAWIENAHSITHNWFINLTEGELQRSFE
jgi:uncharacterized protein (TIGR04255 family)